MASLPPFIDREDLANALSPGSPPDLSSDDHATVAVDAACDVCRIACGQDFNEVTNDVIVLDGTNSDALILPQIPVSEVSEVVVGDDTLVVDDDYKLTGNGILVRTWPMRWRWGRQNIRVTYTRGYPDDELPRDVRVVALALAKRIYQAASSGSVRSETIGAYSVTYATGAEQIQSADLTKGERFILYKYRRPR